MAKTQKQIVPYLTVSNGNAAIAFYKKGLGAKEVMRMPAEDKKRLMHAEVEINGHSLYLSDDFPEFTGGPNTPQKHGGTPVSDVRAADGAEGGRSVDRARRKGGRENDHARGGSVLGRPVRADHRSVRAFLVVRGAVAEAEEKGARQEGEIQIKSGALATGVTSHHRAQT